MTFLSCRLVTTPQHPSSDIMLSSVLHTFGHIFFIRVSPIRWCHPGQSAPAPPLVTPLHDSKETELKVTDRIAQERTYSITGM